MMLLFNQVVIPVRTRACDAAVTEYVCNGRRVLRGSKNGRNGDKRRRGRLQVPRHIYGWTKPCPRWDSQQKKAS